MPVLEESQQKYHVVLVDKTGNSSNDSGADNAGDLLLDGTTTCENLSSIVRSIRPDLESTPIAFFLNSQIIKTNIHDSALLNALTGEDILKIEYTVTAAMPSKKNVFANKEWVSSLCFSLKNDRIFAGLYNGNINIWTMDGKLEHEFKQLSSGVRCLKQLIWYGEHNKNTYYYIAGFENSELHLFTHNLAAKNVKDDSEKSFLEDSVFITPHKLAIVDMDLLNNTNIVLSSSDDQTSKLLRIELCNGKNSIVELQSYHQHTLSVLSSKFVDDHSFISVSLDSTVKKMDVETPNSDVQSFQMPSPILSLCLKDSDKNIALVGMMNNTISLVDLRAQDSKFSKTTFRKHTNAVSCLSNDPMSGEYNFFSASYDKTIKHWDMRSPTVPLYDIGDHAGRVLALSCKDYFVASGATDGNLNIYNRHDFKIDA